MRKTFASCLLVILLCVFGGAAQGAPGEDWPQALSRMPLRTDARELNRTNCVALLLSAFQSNETVKALIFMPGATDEFYMFRRARAGLTQTRPTLYDAVQALTNQTLIRATFLPPLLLLHTDEDPLEPCIEIQHPATAEKLRNHRLVPHLALNDRDWGVVEPLLRKSLKVSVFPWGRSYDSWHFYRHSLAAWNLTGWQTLEAIALAGKTKCSVQRRRVMFEGDERVRATPKVDPTWIQSGRP